MFSKFRSFTHGISEKPVLVVSSLGSYICCDYETTQGIFGSVSCQICCFFSVLITKIDNITHLIHAGRWGVAKHWVAQECDNEMCNECTKKS